MSLSFYVPDGYSAQIVRNADGSWRINLWENSPAPIGQYVQPSGQYTQPSAQYAQPALCESGWYGGLDAPHEAIEAEKEEEDDEVPLRRSQSSPPTVGCYTEEVKAEEPNSVETKTEEAKTEETEVEEPESVDDDPWSNDIDDEYIRKVEKEEEILDELIIVQNPNLCNVTDYVRFVYNLTSHRGHKVVTFVYLRKEEQVMVTMPHSEVKDGMLLDGIKYRVKPEYQSLTFDGFIKTPVFRGV